LRLFFETSGHHVVDGYLQVFQAGAIETLDALGGQQVPVGYEAAERAGGTDAAEDGVQVWMEQGLPAGEGHDGCTQLGQLVDAAEQGLQRHRLRDRVELVAVGASQVAAPHGDEMRQDGMVRREQTLGDHLPLAEAAMHRVDLAPGSDGICGHVQSGY